MNRTKDALIDGLGWLLSTCEHYVILAWYRLRDAWRYPAARAALRHTPFLSLPVEQRLALVRFHGDKFYPPS